MDKTTDNKCQIYHYVRQIDDEQTRAYYDYFWCNTHHRRCELPPRELEEAYRCNQSQREVET